VLINLEVLDDVYREVDDLDDKTIMDIMKTLVNIDTTVPPANTYRKYVDAISPYFKNLGFFLEEVILPEEVVKKIQYPIEGPRINLVATKDYGQDKIVSFYGHMDVVPAPNDGKNKWRFPPFEATLIKNGKIYGRGTADMKGSMVCLILALQIIEKLNLKPKYNVRVLNCTDEELGGEPGVKYLAEQGHVKGTVFCMEGVTSPIIIVACAGALNVIVESIGRSCHSGMNFMGINALEESVPILVELMELKKEVEMRESKDIPGYPKLGSGEQRMMTPMFNLDVIRSGDKANIVPNLCTLTINRRIIPEENVNDVIKEISEAIERGKARSKLIDVKTMYLYDYPALCIDPNAPDVKRMKKVISVVQKIPEDRVVNIGMSGSTDMGNVCEILDTHDIIMHGCGNPGSNLHGVNETIKMKDVKLYIKELITFLCADL
jgi:succinyl-diaminopimelate desuccinylase